MDEKELIINNQNLIYYVIKKYEKYYAKEDLFQAGALGLIQASRNFDPSYNCAFSTFAVKHILGEVKKYIREDRNIKVSREYLKLNQSIDKAREFLSQKLMRKPTDSELALFLEMDEEKMAEVKSANEFVRSIYSDNEEEFNLCDVIGKEEKEYDCDIQSLKVELENLKEEEKEIIVERYFNELTQSEASTKLGMSQAQVSRKEKKILMKLKERLVA